MSLPPSLLISARSTYRSVLRAARITFAGDLPRRAALESAVRATFESPTLTPPTPSSSSSSSSSSAAAAAAASASSPGSNGVGQIGVNPELISQRLAEWREIASFLRRNVVQGEMDESGSYSRKLYPASRSILVSPIVHVPTSTTPTPADNPELRLTKDTELNDNDRNAPSPTAPLTPFPNRDKNAPKRKCGETPPEAPAFW